MLFGTLVAETILASVHVRAHRQAGHMDASDLIKTLQKSLQGGGRPHKKSCSVVSSWRHRLPLRAVVCRQRSSGTSRAKRLVRALSMWSPSDVNSDAISRPISSACAGDDSNLCREFVSVSVLRCDHGCDRLVDMRLRAGRHCIGQHHRWRAGPFAQFIECLL